MKKLICGILSVLTVLMFLSGCTVEVQEENKEKGNSYYIYSVNQDETELKKEEYIPQEETVDFMIKDLMQRLNNKASESDEINLLPKDVEMTSHIIEDSVLTIEFNKEYNNISRAREILVRAGVVKTFLQVPGITAVKFTVNGSPLLNSKEEPVGNMTNSSFVELSGDDADSYCHSTFTLYFTDKTGKKLVKEERTVRYKRNLSKERVILEQLMKGPMEKGHYPTVSENTEVLSVMTADQICYVKLDEVFSAYAIDVSEQIPIYSIVNSLLDAVDADKVQITVGNNAERTFGEKMSLYRFYEKNEKIVEE